VIDRNRCLPQLYAGHRRSATSTEHEENVITLMKVLFLHFKDRGQFRTSHSWKK